MIIKYQKTHINHPTPLHMDYEGRKREQLTVSVVDQVWNGRWTFFIIVIHLRL